MIATTRMRAMLPPVIRICRSICSPANHTPPPPETDDATIDIDGIMDRMRWLVDKVTADGWFEARVLPQLHVLLWGNKRGV